MLPPRGPLKWRWLTRMINKLATAAGIISPEQTIAINPTTGGLTLSTIQSTSTTGAEWTADIVNNRWLVKGGTIYINSYPPIVVPDVTISPDDGQLVCVEVAFTLSASGYNLTPIFAELLASGDINGTPTAEIKAVSPSTFAAAQSCLPGSRSDGLILIPLLISKNGAPRQIAPSRSFYLTIYHQDFSLQFP